MADTKKPDIARLTEMLSLPCAEGHYGVLLDRNGEYFWYFSAKVVDQPEDDEDGRVFPAIVPSDPERAKVKVTEEEVSQLQVAGRIQRYIAQRNFNLKIDRPRSFVRFTAR